MSGTVVSLQQVQFVFWKAQTSRELARSLSAGLEVRSLLQPIAPECAVTRRNLAVFIDNFI
jgi:hypothetical protein